MDRDMHTVATSLTHFETFKTGWPILKQAAHSKWAVWPGCFKMV